MLSLIKDTIEKIQPRFMIIAVILAFVLWIFCMNYADPLTNQNFTIALELRNEHALTDSRWVLMNYRELEHIVINVRVAGLKSELDYLYREDTLSAYIDFLTSDWVAMPGAWVNEPIPVRIGISFNNDIPSENLQITSIFPNTVDVIVDRLETRPFNTAILFNEADLPDGYVVLTPELEPTNVRLTGARSILSQIYNRGVGVTVNVSDARTDISGELEITAYDTFGHIITGYQINEPTLRFRLPIAKVGMININLGEPIGEPSPDVAVLAVDWEPKTVELIGHVDEVEQIQNILIESVDITGIADTSFFTVDINSYLAAINEERGLNVSLRHANQNKVSVIFYTEPIISQTFVIPIDEVHFSGEASRREIITGEITVSLRGVASVMEDIQTANIICRVNAAALADMPDGEYVLDVEITVPYGAELSGVPPTVTILLITPDNNTSGIMDTP
jgi:YbbR domain-containing protein